MSKPTWQVKTVGGERVAVPFDPVSQEWFAGFKDNQILTGKLDGTRKPRSVTQLKFYWVAAGIVADNNRMNLSSKEQVDYYIRNRLNFFDTDKTVVMPGGQVIFYPRSIALRNLSHIEACNYFDRAFEVMAEILECSVPELIEALERE